MADLSRRELIQLTGAAAASATVPAIAHAEPSAALRALYDKVLATIPEMESYNPPTLYSRLFHKTVAADPHCAACDARLEEATEIVHVSSSQRKSAQRFVYRVPHHEYGLGCAIRPDLHNPERAYNDIKPSMLGIANALKERREIAAAEVFNQGTRYNASICGDGQALFSDGHPMDDGIWSNVLAGGERLTTESIKALVQHIRTKCVDDAGIKIVAAIHNLVVPVALMDRAYNAVANLNPKAYPELTGDSVLVWDYLESPDNWYITTRVPGLAHSERRPMRLRAVMDAAANNVLIIGEEKYGFACTDPRAAYASLPSANRVS